MRKKVSRYLMLDALTTEGVTAAEAAKALGVTEGKIMRLLNEGSKANPELANKFYTLFGIPQELQDWPCSSCPSVLHDFSLCFDVCPGNTYAAAVKLVV